MLRPLRDFVVVAPIERAVSSVLTVIHHEKPSVGRVVAVGPGKVVKGRRRPLDVPVGAMVRFGTDAGYLNYPEYFEDGQRFLVLQEADICWASDIA